MKFPNKKNLELAEATPERYHNLIIVNRKSMSRAIKQFSNLKAFTLIELLVVISIIGLLASIVFVAVGSARGKSRIAAGQQFASNVDHVVGAYAVAKYDFNEGSGSIVADSSGYNNTGTITGATWTTDTPSGKGHALSFNGNGDYVLVNDSISINLSENNAITVSAWVNPNAGYGQVYPKIVQKGDNAGGMESMVEWQLYIDASIGRLGAEINPLGSLQYSNEVILTGRWSHVAMSYSKSLRTLDLYINGVRVAHNAAYGDYNIDNGDDEMYIGNRYGLDRGYSGRIDDVWIYSEALGQAQIQKIYAEGLRKHNLVDSR